MWGVLAGVLVAVGLLAAMSLYPFASLLVVGAVALALSAWLTVKAVEHERRFRDLVRRANPEIEEKEVRRLARKFMRAARIYDD